MLEVRRLRLLSELEARGTIAAVAVALHQSASSVSQQLALLEREADVQLFRKTGRRIQLTAQAEILVEHARVILRQLEQAETDLAASQEVAAGTVRVAAFQSAALAFIPRVLTELAKTHPQIQVSLTQREPETALRETWARDFDLVVAEQYPGHAAAWHSGMDRIDLTHDRLRLAVPLHGPLGRISSLQDAHKAPWIVEPAGAASRHWVEQQCRSAGYEPKVRFETADLQAHVALVESGNGVAVLPELMYAQRPIQARLVDLPGYPRRTVFTATRESLSGRASILACRSTLALVAMSFSSR